MALGLTAAAWAAIVGAAGTATTTGLALSKGSPSLPKPPPPPAAPPPPPPPPAAAPPFAPDTEAGDPQAKAKRRREQSYGIEQTMLSSPLGGGPASRSTPSTVLGG
jgi:hypothetical protein